jgi:hypothetical protein
MRLVLISSCLLFLYLFQALAYPGYEDDVQAAFDQLSPEEKEASKNSNVAYRVKMR